MDDKRKLKRRYIMFYSRVFDRSTGMMIGYLSDITPGGAMIISEEPNTTKTLYRLVMDLPEDVFDKENLSFEAKCVWSKQDANPHFYMSGFQMENIAAEDTEIIERIIEDYGFRD
jgi:hypothetical protein